MPAAAGLHARALELLEDAHAERAELALELGIALAEVGQLTRADQVFTSGIELAVKAGQEQTKWLLRLEREDVRYFALRFRTLDDAIDLALDAQGASEELSDQRVLARAWRLLGDCFFRSGRNADAAQAIDRAAEYARQADWPREISYETIAPHVLGPTPVSDTIERVLRYLDRPAPRAEVLGQLAYLYGMHERFEEARELVREAETRLSRPGAQVESGVGLDVRGNDGAPR